jgi:response regulator RpfG family c-di-GMP phosphodiesterase
MTDLFFLDEEETPNEIHPTWPNWKILIVDDEEDIHAITKLALKNFAFERRGLSFYHAYSAIEAKQILQQHSDIALIMLDVVMESDHAGLKLVKTIRQELNNLTVRIVLRTGQPGQAPEQEVIRDYDINDYKNKTELTASKLTTLMYASLRAYRDIVILEKSKQGLEKLIVASRGISSRGALSKFISVTLNQMVNLLNLDNTVIFSCKSNAFEFDGNKLKVYSLSGDNLSTELVSLSELPENIAEILLQAFNNQANVFHHNSLVMFCANQSCTILFYAQVGHPLSELDRHLLNIFTENLIVILENIHLNELITSSQRELIYRLGEIVESRSNETGNHVKRVAYYSELLARLVGLSEEESELLKISSPLHDIGKMGIPDSILHKPGKLTSDEWKIMQTHAQRGYDLLCGSKLMVMDIGAIIALAHHEKWDGSGYPNGLEKDNIHIYGRITALADVFDALGSDRCYKKKWPLADVLELIKQQSGKHFDPRLVKLFLDNLDQFLGIRDQFVDS